MVTVTSYKVFFEYMGFNYLTSCLFTKLERLKLKYQDSKNIFNQTKAFITLNPNETNVCTCMMCV